MNGKILIAYASTHGSTAEIAAAIACQYQQAGLEAAALPAGKVRSLAGWSAVVLASPLYMFHLHKDVHSFLRRHKAALQAGLPCAIIAGGSINNPDLQERQEVLRQVEHELAKIPWFKPESVEVAGGRFDPTHLSFPWNLVPALRGRPAVDFRDWQAIHAWAASLPEKLGLQTASQQAGSGRVQA